MIKHIICSLLVSLMMMQFCTAQSNHAVGKKATQSSTFQTGSADKAIDDNTDGNWSSGSVTHTLEEMNPWWQVDLGGTFDITGLEFHNRMDCCKERFDNLEIYLSDTPDFKDKSPFIVIEYSDKFDSSPAAWKGKAQNARYIRIVRKSDKPVILSLAEVKVHGIQTLNPSSILVFNEAGYVSRYTLTYKIGQMEYKEESGNLALGSGLTFSVPYFAKDVKIKGEGQTGLIWEPWRTTFERSIPKNISTCFKSYGTTLNQQWAEDCKRFGE